MLNSIRLVNFLSYGPEALEIPLRNLNVIIGANASGKSNLIEAIGLLRSTPDDLGLIVRKGSRVRDWIWQGDEGGGIASVEVVADRDDHKYIQQNIRYRFDFSDNNDRFSIVDEKIEYEWPQAGKDMPFFFYKYENGHPVINAKVQEDSWRGRTLRREEVNPEKSILAQRYDPHIYTEISWLVDRFRNIRIYRDWTFGPDSPPRNPQNLDMPSDYLLENMANLPGFLSKLLRDRKTEDLLLELFSKSYDGIRGIGFDISRNYNEVYVKEGDRTVSPRRLSDGTLRMLCLLAILCDPDPPGLVCIDEPELGLHPDLINTLAIAIKYASERTQLILTTHSAGLVDAFTSSPEDVLVCEKDDGATQIHRLERDKLKGWLAEYSGLGELWSRGFIGGTRW